MLLQRCHAGTPFIFIYSGLFFDICVRCWLLFTCPWKFLFVCFQNLSQTHMLNDLIQEVKEKGHKMKICPPPDTNLVWPTHHSASGISDSVTDANSLCVCVCVFRALWLWLSPVRSHSRLPWCCSCTVWRKQGKDLYLPKSSLLSSVRSTTSHSTFTEPIQTHCTSF